MMNVIYLQRSYSKNSFPLKGERLFEAFRRDADACRLGYVITDYNEVSDKEYSSDYVTPSQIEELQPDLIFVEGGIIDLGEFPKIKTNDIERYVDAGATVIIADVNWNALNQHRKAYQDIESLLGVSFVWERNEPAEMFDRHWFVDSHRQIVVQPNDIIYDKKFAPIYEDIGPFIVGHPVPLRYWSQLICTCNKSSTQGWYNIGGHSFAEPVTSAFASAKKIGAGYLVLIAGAVSSDVWVEIFPTNVTWLQRLAANLVERVRIERRRGALTHQVFISHRHSVAPFAKRFRNELRRRGFGTWIDVHKLVPGDELTPEIIEAIQSSTHLAVLWSQDCPEAHWVKLELTKALELGKRIFIIRIDDTAPPPGFEDHLRIEAQALAPEETGRLVSLSIERIECRQKLNS